MKIPLTALIVDGDSSYATMLGRYLGEMPLWQVSCHTCHTQKEAINKIRELSPDVVFVDDLSGNGAGTNAGTKRTRFLKEIGSNAEFILLVDTGGERAVDRARQAGTSDYLVKPELSPDMLSGFLRHIIARKKAEEALRNAEKRIELASLIFESAVDGIVIADAENKIEYVNPAFVSITGYTAKEAIGKNPRLLRSDRHDKSFYEEMWRAIMETGRWHGTIWNRRKSGEAYPEWLTITATKNARDEVTNYIAVFHDITDVKQIEEEMKYQAYHDALTGLPNRLLFKDRLNLAITAGKRQKGNLAVLFAGLDRFSNINESLGHATGDMVLQNVAMRIRGCVGEEDTVSRFGGDEFAIILSGISDEGSALKMAHGIMNSFYNPFIVDEHELYLTASIGVSLYPVDSREAESLVTNASLAMKRAKADGKNICNLYKPDMNTSASQRLTLESSLRKALKREEFIVYYQPKLDVKTQLITGMEALARWMHPVSGIVLPGGFIPLAEETGMIVPIGEWVLREACRRAKRWHDKGYKNLGVSVNLSALQFQRQNLVKMIKSALDDTGLNPDRLEMEITESVVMDEVESAITTMREINEMGVRISIDDFGRTGYSSLGYLKRFPIHALKIDRTFVRDITTDRDSATIAAAIISMGHSLRLKVIAEGVETREQMDFLRQRDCDEVQGFLFSPPVPEEMFLKLLRKKDNLIHNK